jgi:chemotaxis-related protein WspD
LKKHLDTLQGCWKDVGIFGNGSCPELAGLIHCRHCPVYAAAGRRQLDQDLPPGYLEERTSVMAQPKETAETGTLSVLVFRLAGERFALRTLFFSEAADASPIHSLPPRTNRIFRGLANMGGELLLCVSLADLLDLTGLPRRPESRMVVVSKDGQRFTFPVEEIVGVHRIVPGALADVPATLSRSARSLTRAIFFLDGHHVGLLDEERLFPAMIRSLTP